MKNRADKQVEFPPLPILPARSSLDVVMRPRRMVLPTKDGSFLATKNFDDDVPIWRIYKRLGWAVRYTKGQKTKRRMK